MGLGGSLDGTSNSMVALEIAMAAARCAGADTQTLDLHDMRLPFYEPRAAETPCVRDFVETMYAADGLIWSSPLYHGSFSGAFKNALDWLELLKRRQPAYLTDKVVGLICTAGGAQGLQAVNTMEFVVRALRGWTVPLVAPISHAWHAFDDDGHALDPAVHDRLAALGHEVARSARIFAHHVPVAPDVVAEEDAQRN